jgi:hypothetical protein
MAIGEINGSQVDGFNVSQLNSMNIRAILLSSNISLNMDADLDVDVIREDNNSLIALSDSANAGNGWYVKPSKAFSVDNTFYAKNVKFYSVCENYRGVGIAEDWSAGGSIPSIASNNLIKIGELAYGKLRLTIANSGKLQVNSANVDVLGGGVGDDSPYAYVQCAKCVSNAAIRFDQNLDGNNFTYEIRKITDSILLVGTWFSPWSDGATTSILESADIEKSTISLGAQRLLFNSSRISNCCVNGYGSFAADKFAGSGYSGGYSYWSSQFVLGNNTAVEGSWFGNCLVTMQSPDRKHFKNIKFNGNRCNAANGSNTFLDLGGYDTVIGSAIPWGVINYWNGNESLQQDIPFIMEGIEFVGNGQPSDPHVFKILARSYEGETAYIEGHIEVDGYYDYSYCNNTIAGRTFPMNGRNIPYQPWINYPGSSEYIDKLCLYVLGDPLKYIDDRPKFGGSSFITVSPWYKDLIRYSNYMPIARQNYVETVAEDETDNRSSSVRKMLRCNEGNFKLYRIRE